MPFFDFLNPEAAQGGYGGSGRMSRTSYSQPASVQSNAQPPSLPMGAAAPGVGGGEGYSGPTGGFNPTSFISKTLGLLTEPTTGRNLYGEGYNTLAAESYLAGPQLGLEQYYRPQYAGLERDIYGQSLGGFFGQVPGYRQAMDPANAALYGEMNQQALSELQMGATLDPSLRREVQQSVRGGQAARGVGFGPSDIYEEALQTGSAGQALRNQRRAYAGQVAGLNLQATQPYFGLASQGAQYAQAGGANLFNPWSPYGQDLYNTNFNAEVARKIATANANAQIIAAALQAAGAAVPF